MVVDAVDKNVLMKTQPVGPCTAGKMYEWKCMDIQWIVNTYGSRREAMPKAFIMLASVYSYFHNCSNILLACSPHLYSVMNDNVIKKMDLFRKTGT
jgi:hypothetical protein